VKIPLVLMLVLTYLSRNRNICVFLCCKHVKILFLTVTLKWDQYRYPV